MPRRLDASTPRRLEIMSSKARTQHRETCIEPQQQTSRGRHSTSSQAYVGFQADFRADF
ncbi:hypothetical protein E4U53_002595 [Claviceps sorghi]|nr:hypothetical protein E4U53_002595 [Claviceps sorghi]